MNLTKIIVVVVILLVIVLLISTNCKTKENNDPCASDRNLKKGCHTDLDCKDSWCHDDCDQCFKKKDNGWGCSRDNQCGNSSYCNGDKCVEKHQDMDKCSRDNQCKSNRCEWTGVNYRCIPKNGLTHGYLCDNNNQCNTKCCSSLGGRDDNFCNYSRNVKTGQSCKEDCDCVSGRCHNGIFGSGKCD
tara:strand:- start:519 stop:1079 length:561 start_codon:yes stop_codon:yes gene_type:complete